MEKRIQEVLKGKIDPILEEHFGGASLSGFEDGIVKVRMTGACGSCPSAQYTVEDVVKQILMEEIPEIKDVVLDTSVSDDLLDMARKLMKSN